MPRKHSKLVEITARGPADKKDEAAAFFFAAGSQGVVELDTPLPDKVLVSYTSHDAPPPEAEASGGGASFKTYLDAAEPLARLTQALKSIGWSFTSCPYKDLDWIKKSRSAIKPIRIFPSKKGGRKRSILVRPTWSKAQKKPGETAIVLDPGMAFGTGSHFTTKSCLTALLDITEDRAAKGDFSFLDVGAGTGVLAIAAKKLGAKRAVGVDIDPVAVRVAKANAKRNRVKIAASATPVECVKGTFNVVAANILAGPLKTLAPVIAAKTAERGFLILSGILCEEADEVVKVYEGRGFMQIKRYSDNEWATLLMGRVK